MITAHNSVQEQAHSLVRSHCDNSTSTCSSVFHVTVPEERYVLFWHGHADTRLRQYGICKFFSPSAIMAIIILFLVGSSSQLLNYMLTERNGMVFAFCSSQMENIKTCTVQYSMNRFYGNLSQPVTGPINTLFHVCFMEPTSAIYYHQASVMISPTLEVIVRSHIAFNSSLPSTINLEVYQLGLLGLLFVMVLFTSVTIIVLLLCKGTYTIDGLLVKFNCLLTVSGYPF